SAANEFEPPERPVRHRDVTTTTRAEHSRRVRATHVVVAYECIKLCEQCELIPTPALLVSNPSGTQTLLDHCPGFPQSTRRSLQHAQHLEREGKFRQVSGLSCLTVRTAMRAHPHLIVANERGRLAEKEQATQLIHLALKLQRRRK